MKRYIEIKKINLNESKQVLTEADDDQATQNAQQNAQTQTAPTQSANQNATPTPNKQQLDAFTKDWTDAMNALVNSGYLDENNARYSNLFNEQNIKSILDQATSKNSKALSEAKELRDLIGKLTNVNGNDYSIILPEMLEAAKNLVEYVDNLSQQQWIYKVIKDSKTFTEYILKLRGIIVQYNNIIKKLNKQSISTFSDLIKAIIGNQIDTKISLGDFENLDTLYKALGKDVSKKFYTKIDNMLTKTQVLTLEEAEKITDNIATFKEILAKLYRSFINKALTEPRETLTNISTVFDNGKMPESLADRASQTPKQLAYELLHQELLGNNVRTYNPKDIFYLWEADNVSQTLNKKIPAILAELKKELELPIWNNQITNLQELQAFIEPMNSVISFYSPAYVVDKNNISHNISQIVGNSGWAECMTVIREIIFNSNVQISSDDNVADQNKSTKDWETLIKQAGNDTAELEKIWKDYFNTEWHETEGMYNNIRVISKAFVNELLTLGFTETLNPFIAYLRRHKSWLNEELWTAEKYNAIHNAYIREYISKEALRGTDIRDSNGATINIINSRKLIEANTARMIFEYLELQGQVFASYSQTPQFSSPILTACYSGQLGSFITDLFYTPGNPILIENEIKKQSINGIDLNNAGDIARALNEMRNKQSDGIGNLFAAIKPLPEVRDQMQKCLKNKQTNVRGATKFAADAKSLLAKINTNDIKPFITYLYIANGSSPEALDVMHKYGINENTSFDVSKSKAFSKIVKNLNITDGNVADIIESIAKEAGL